MDDSTLASQFADRIASCESKEKLAEVRAEIQAYFDKNPTFKKEWYKWLAGERDSRIMVLEQEDKDAESMA